MLLDINIYIYFCIHRSKLSVFPCLCISVPVLFIMIVYSQDTIFQKQNVCYSNYFSVCTKLMRVYCLVFCSVSSYFVCETLENTSELYSQQFYCSYHKHGWEFAIYFKNKL